MSQANAGDREAYQCLMTELGDVVEAYLRSRFGSSDFIEDCVQDSLLAIHRARSSYDPKRPFRPWLFTIVRHKVIDALRRRGVREREEAVGDELDTRFDPAPHDPERSIDGARLLDALPAAQSEAIRLTKYEGHSIAEAASRAGISQTAMKTRVHRAIRSVRHALDREGLG